MSAPQGIGWASSQNRVRAETFVRDDVTRRQIVVEIEVCDMDEPRENLAMRRAMEAADRAIGRVQGLPKEQVEREWRACLDEFKRCKVRFIPTPDASQMET